MAEAALSCKGEPAAVPVTSLAVPGIPPRQAAAVEALWKPGQLRTSPVAAAQGKKASQLILRFGKENRGALAGLCRDLDTTAAREIRRFIQRILT
ncbi:hypothetical protein [Leisingera aquaemixtae]|uniref:hypothetical protein n=1 Tax=Leisingera aquaemixtae TaxID=1396826 RepID=UPI0011AE78F4|nr:hypothetical protein [Leisingera aquaemixtae]